MKNSLRRFRPLAEVKCLRGQRHPANAVEADFRTVANRATFAAQSNHDLRRLGGTYFEGKPGTVVDRLVLRPDKHRELAAIQQVALAEPRSGKRRVEHDLVCTQSPR